jgi:hypothetical protein
MLKVGYSEGALLGWLETVGVPVGTRDSEG